MQYNELARVLSARLSLRMPPIALAFVTTAPPGVPAIDDPPAPSSCALWRRAEAEVFYAPAGMHFNCPLGAMVMGFHLPDAQMRQLEAAVQMMCGLAYVRAEEVERVPKMAAASAGIVYGPLGRFPLHPDAVLLWVTPRQGMLLGECCGLVNWAAAPSAMLGRPGCASIPVAVAAGRAAQSFGCIGMRVNTGVPEELFLMVLPAAVLDGLSRDLERTCAVNRELETYYHERVTRLSTAGVPPTGPAR